MGLLNQASDGIPSALLALLRAVRRLGPLPRQELLAVCCPPSFVDPQKAGQTLGRWTQLGLFIRTGELIELHADVQGLPADGYHEVRALAPLLRRIVLDPNNNRDLNVPEPELAADFTLGLTWLLAQDLFAIRGGPYVHVEPLVAAQFGTTEPRAFRNSDRWTGFRAWAPLLGFGWADAQGAYVVDPTPAVRDALPRVFGTLAELSTEEFLLRLAALLPVVDSGEYREQVESRLARRAWRATEGHEISVSLSTALKRLDAAHILRLQARGDAPKRQLLGRGHRPLEQVSHLVWGSATHA